VGNLKLFKFEVEPVITVSVETNERGCIIKLLGCELKGSKIAEAQNSKFKATMTNVVEWRERVPTEGEGEVEGNDATKEILSETTINVDLIVPPWFLVPVPAIEKTGSSVMQGVVNTMVPRFLAQLDKDYELWASGDGSRKPIDGSLDDDL